VELLGPVNHGDHVCRTSKSATARLGSVNGNSLLPASTPTTTPGMKSLHYTDLLIK